MRDKVAWMSNSALVWLLSDPTTTYTTGTGNETRTQTQNGVTTTFSYDRAGNQVQAVYPGGTSTYDYDALDRMTGATSANFAVTYTYDALGQRNYQAVTQNGVTTQTWFSYDHGQVWGELPGGAFSVRYVLGQGVDEKLAWMSSSSLVWLLSDRQGSTLNVVNTGGAVYGTVTYDPFANVVSESGNNNVGPYLWQGLRQAPDGFYWGDGFQRPTELDTALGKYEGVDPAQEGTNWYVEDGNQAVNVVDPSGLDRKEKVFPACSGS